MADFEIHASHPSQRAHQPRISHLSQNPGVPCIADNSHIAPSPTSQQPRTEGGPQPGRANRSGVTELERCTGAKLRKYDMAHLAHARNPTGSVLQWRCETRTAYPPTHRPHKQETGKQEQATRTNRRTPPGMKRASARQGWPHHRALRLGRAVIAAHSARYRAVHGVRCGPAYKSVQAAYSKYRVYL